jgi:hypothetical protein
VLTVLDSGYAVSKQDVPAAAIAFEDLVKQRQLSVVPTGNPAESVDTSLN